MSTFDALKLGLNRGSQGQARLAGFDEDFARANALRGTQNAKPDEWGQTSPLMVMADMMANSQGRKQARELRPQREAARADVASSANLMGLHQAKQKENEFNYQKQHDTNEGSEVVELVSDADPKDVIAARMFGGKYFDQFTGEQITGEGRHARVKNTRSSGSIYQIIKGKDAHGNDVWLSHNKQTNEMNPSKFIDGWEYDPNIAAEEGVTRAGQKEAESAGTERGKQRQQRIAEITQNSESAAMTMDALNQAEQAVKDGAWSGAFESMLPSFRDASQDLDNAKQRLGLAQLGKHTMGSLSEAEGAWLRDSEIPNLDEDELPAYFAHRREATQRAMLANQYEKDALVAGEEVDTDVINSILVGDGFDISEMGWRK